MNIKNMEFQEHPGAHFAVDLNQFHISFNLVIAQEALNHSDKAVPSFFFPFY